MKLYLISKQSATWLDINETLIHGFKENGFDVEHSSNPNIIDLTSNSIYFIAGHAETLNHHSILRHKLDRFDISNKKCTIILFYFERYPFDNDIDNVSAMVPPMRNALIENNNDKLYDYIFSAERGYLNTMLSDGIDVKYFQYGFYNSYNNILPETQNTNFGDIVFCGTLYGSSSRRANIINELSKYHKINVINGAWKDKRNAGYKNSKITLNLGYDMPLTLNINRLLYSMSNKSLTISEPIRYTEPFEDGVHLITAPINELPNVIEYYLTHDKEREEIINNAYQYVVNDLKIENTIADTIKKYLK